MSDDTLRISDNLQDLVGIGLEYWIRKDGIIVKFYNGNFANDICSKGNTEETKLVV